MEPITPILYVAFGIAGGIWSLFKFLSVRLEKRMEVITNSVQQKLDKQEHQLALARIDRDMDQLRADQNGRLDRIEAKLDKVIEWAVEAKK